jgi:DNA-binding response OmpR family regulator
MAGNGERVLLVEDEEEVREFTARVLRDNGYVVATAESAEEGMREFDRDDADFDLVLSDAVLPDVSGREMAGRMFRKRPGLSIIISSGYAEEGNRETSREDGKFDFLRKPYSVIDLLKAVKKALKPA